MNYSCKKNFVEKKGNESKQEQSQNGMPNHFNEQTKESLHIFLSKPEDNDIAYAINLVIHHVTQHDTDCNDLNRGGSAFRYMHICDNCFLRAFCEHQGFKYDTLDKESGALYDPRITSNMWDYVKSLCSSSETLAKEFQSMKGCTNGEQKNPSILAEELLDNLPSLFIGNDVELTENEDRFVLTLDEFNPHTFLTKHNPFIFSLSDPRHDDIWTSVTQNVSNDTTVKTLVKMYNIEKFKSQTLFGSDDMHYNRAFHVVDDISLLHDMLIRDVGYMSVTYMWLARKNKWDLQIIDEKTLFKSIYNASPGETKSEITRFLLQRAEFVEISKHMNEKLPIDSVKHWFYEWNENDKMSDICTKACKNVFTLLKYIHSDKKIDLKFIRQQCTKYGVVEAMAKVIVNCNNNGSIDDFKSQGKSIDDFKSQGKLAISISKKHRNIRNFRKRRLKLIEAIEPHIAVRLQTQHHSDAFMATSMYIRQNPNVEQEEKRFSDNYSEIGNTLSWLHTQFHFSLRLSDSHEHALSVLIAVIDSCRISGQTKKCTGWKSKFNIDQEVDPLRFLLVLTGPKAAGKSYAANSIYGCLPKDYIQILSNMTLASITNNKQNYSGKVFAMDEAQAGFFKTNIHSNGMEQNTTWLTLISNAYLSSMKSEVNEKTRNYDGTTKDAWLYTSFIMLTNKSENDMNDALADRAHTRTVGRQANTNDREESDTRFKDPRQHKDLRIAIHRVRVLAGVISYLEFTGVVPRIYLGWSDMLFSIVINRYMQQKGIYTPAKTNDSRVRNRFRIATRALTIWSFSRLINRFANKGMDLKTIVALFPLLGFAGTQHAMLAMLLIGSTEIDKPIERMYLRCIYEIFFMKTVANGTFNTTLGILPKNANDGSREEAPPCLTEGHYVWARIPRSGMAHANSRNGDKAMFNACKNLARLITSSHVSRDKGFQNHHLMHWLFSQTKTNVPINTDKGKIERPALVFYRTHFGFVRSLFNYPDLLKKSIHLRCELDKNDIADFESHTDKNIIKEKNELMKNVFSVIGMNKNNMTSQVTIKSVVKDVVKALYCEKSAIDLHCEFPLLTPAERRQWSRLCELDIDECESQHCNCKNIVKTVNSRFANVDDFQLETLFNNKLDYTNDKNERLLRMPSMSMHITKWASVHGVPPLNLIHAFESMNKLEDVTKIRNMLDLDSPPNDIGGYVWDENSMNTNECDKVACMFRLLDDMKEDNTRKKLSWTLKTRILLQGMRTFTELKSLEPAKRKSDSIAGQSYKLKRKKRRMENRNKILSKKSEERKTYIRKQRSSLKDKLVYIAGLLETDLEDQEKNEWINEFKKTMTEALNIVKNKCDDNLETFWKKMKQISVDM